MAVCLILQGCGRPILSHHPLFSDADANGAPALRSGVWLFGPQGECAFDRSKSTASWPDCVNWTLIAQGRIVGAEWKGSIARKIPILASHPFVLAAGDPRLLQEPSAQHPWSYGYKAMKPVRMDEEGRVIEAQVWEMLCEPITQKEPLPMPPPVPGMTQTKNACFAKDAAILRSATGPNMKWSDPTTMTWVRDGDG